MNTYTVTTYNSEGDAGLIKLKRRGLLGLDRVPKIASKAKGVNMQKELAGSISPERGEILRQKTLHQRDTELDD